MRHIGLSIPGTAPDRTPRTSIEFAQRAEAAGAHSVWATDRLVDSTPDVFVTMAAVAATTTRVLIGSSVTLGVLRPPLLLAKSAASVDVLSNGRVILGLGVGSREEDFRAAQVPFAERGRRMDDAIGILKLAWSGEPIRFDGRIHHLDLGPFRELPVQRPHPPIWFGGGAPSVLKRTAEVGQGFIASTSSGPAGFREQWATIAAHADAVGRDIAEITPAALSYAAVAPDRQDAEALMRDHLIRSFGPARLERGLGPLVGTPDDLVRGAHTYFDAGVQVLIVASVSADPRHLDLLCERVLPAIGRG